MEQCRDADQPLPAHAWPDFLCLSKGISGGYLPLSLVLSRPEIQRAFVADELARSSCIPHSYTGNPLACRAALATLDVFEQDDVITQNHTRAQWLADAMAVLASDPRLHRVRQRGLIWAIDVRDELAGEGFAGRFHQAARTRELLVRPIGNTLYVMPPYIFDAAQARWMAGQLQATLDDVLGNTDADKETRHAA